MRPFVEDDLDAYAAIVAEPEVCRYLGNGDTVDRDGAWRQIAVFLGHAQLRGFSQEALVERETGALVGRAGLWQPEGWPGLEVGWLLAPWVWGRGYATEAGRRVARLRVPRARRDEARLADPRDNLPRPVSRSGSATARWRRWRSRAAVRARRPVARAGAGRASATLSTP